MSFIFMMSFIFDQMCFKPVNAHQTAMYLVSFESSLKMKESSDYFMVISQKLFELSKFQIWKLMYRYMYFSLQMTLRVSVSFISHHILSFEIWVVSFSLHMSFKISNVSFESISVWLWVKTAVSQLMVLAQGFDLAFSLMKSLCQNHLMR